MNQRPRTLYKYRSLAGQLRDWVRDSILRCEHYFPSADSFNDPFDCRPNFTLDGSEDELLRYVERVYARALPDLTPEQCALEARAHLSDPARDPRSEANQLVFYALYHEAATRQVGVFCVSERPDEPLMWGHYADCHRGVCLGFSATEAPFSLAEPVRYTTDRPTVNPLKHSNEEMLDHAMFTKAQGWAYEKEWRILSYERGPGPRTVSAKCLTDVILGAQISPEDAREVAGWVRDAGTNIKLHRAQLSRIKYEVSIPTLQCGNED